jgi:N-acetylneuraminic acid mutarotase
VTSVSPDSADVNSAGLTITVDGTNFTPASTVIFGKAALSSTFVSALQLTATVPASALRTEGFLQVTVSNRPPGGGTSTTSAQFQVRGGMLSVTMMGLPSGSPANVTVTGPNDYRATLSASGTLQLPAGRYTITGSGVGVGTSKYFPAVATQTVSVSNSATAFATVNHSTIIPNTTKVLDSAGMSGLTVSADRSSITLPESSPVAASLAVGDVLATAPTTAAPNGLLVKVLSVSTGGGAVTASVTQATLVEAIQQGDFSFNQPLRFVDTAQTSGAQASIAKAQSVRKALHGVTVQSPGTLSDSCSGNPDTFVVPFNQWPVGGQAGLSNDDNGVGVNGEAVLNLSGKLEICPTLQFSFSIVNFRLVSLTAVFSFGDHAQLNVKGALSGSYENELDLLDIRGPVWIVPVGEIPVSLQVVVTPFLGSSGEANSGFYFSTEQDANAKAGLVYANGRVTPVGSATSAATYGLDSLDGSINVKFDAGIKMGVQIYGVLTPNIKTDGYLEWVEPTNGPVWWRLNGGVEAAVGVDLKIFGPVKASFSTPDMTLKQWTIASATVPFSVAAASPTLRSISPSTAPAMGPGFRLALTGSNFVPDSVVYFNGTALATTFVDPGQLNAILPSAELMTPGPYPITVNNPDTSGAISAAQTFNVTVASTSSNQWTWMSGADTMNQPGVYGTQGVPAAGNVPGARDWAVSWIDGSDNLWLFGGSGYDSNGNLGDLNDTWQFNPRSKTWTWMSGANTANQPGVYGTQGVPAAGNVPGARRSAVSWTDSNGNLWLFGGYAYDSAGYEGYLNDLWEFNPTSKMWTWMSGADTANQPGAYGTQGVPATTNVPGARDGAVSWVDTSGNLWLFGGNGRDSNTDWGWGYLDDLWEFNPTSKMWTWMSGADTANQPGVYGTQGVPAAGNVPGARAGAVSWVDTSGNLWLFGGWDLLNDLWEFNPTSKMWTWMSGADTTYQLGVYGTKGVPAAANVPGARADAVSWTDSNGNLWLFGGWWGDFNDLWEFNPTSKMWTWMSGSSTGGATGVYGTKGIPAAANVPGGRHGTVSWIDGSGNLWLFGGASYDSTGTLANLNDLWRYQP